MSIKPSYQELEERISNLESELVKTNDNDFWKEKAEHLIVAHKLKEIEKQSRAWLNNSPVCTKIVDTDFNLQFMSEAGWKALKIDNVEDYYGKPFLFDFYPESFMVPMNRNREKVRKTGDVIEQETYVVDTEGNKLWFHSTLVPINNDDGTLDYIMVVSIEITEGKVALEENLK